MFIQSHMDVPVCYRKGTKTIVIKPRTVTYVISNEALAEELKACYGSRISVITEEMANVIIAETNQEEATPVEATETVPEVTTDVFAWNTTNESALSVEGATETAAPEVTTDVPAEDTTAPADTVDAPAETTDVTETTPAPEVTTDVPAEDTTTAPAETTETKPTRGRKSSK